MSLTLNHLRWWTEKSANVSFNPLLFLIKSFQFVSVYALVYRMYPWPFHAFKILQKWRNVCFIFVRYLSIFNIYKIPLSIFFMHFCKIKFGIWKWSYNYKK